MKNPHKQTYKNRTKNRNQECETEPEGQRDRQGVSQCHIVTLPRAIVDSILVPESDLTRVNRNRSGESQRGNEKDPDESGPESARVNRN